MVSKKGAEIVQRKVTRQEIERLRDRFYKRVARDDKGCYVWTGATNGRGYGVLTVFRLRRMAHRWAWWLENREEPDGVIDHVCRNTLCVNIGHLEVVSRWENTRRGLSPIAQRARQTKCVRGHVFTTRPDGRRVCRECPRSRRIEKFEKEDFMSLFFGGLLESFADEEAPS